MRKLDSIKRLLFSHKAGDTVPISIEEAGILIGHFLGKNATTEAIELAWKSFHTDGSLAWGRWLTLGSRT